MIKARPLENLGSGKLLADRASKIGSSLLPLLGFLTPLSGPAGTAVAILIAAMAIIRGKIGTQFRQLTTNRIVLSILVFFALHLIGLLWTEDLRSGFHIVNKQWRLLLIPVLMTFVRKDHIQLYIDSFIAGMTVTHLASYLYIFTFITFEIMDRISYNPLLALCIYLLGYGLLFTEMPSWKRLLYSVLIISMTVNMFMTQGRTGYLAFFTMLLLISFQYCGKKPLKAFSISLALLLTVSMLSYKYSSVFQKRIDGAINEVQSFEMDRVSPDGNDRITFYLNTLAMIQEHPMLGVGTGDFAGEYEKVNRARSPNVYNTDDPHNGYLLVLAQFGALGLAALLAVFFFQIKCALNTHNSLRHLRLALPVFFMVISLFGSYLLGHFTAITFAYFTAIFYRDCNALS
jgi:O-antigen ligase